MKSVKQRRTEIKAQRAEKRAVAQQDAATEFQSRLLAAEKAYEANRAKQRLSTSKQVWVNSANLRPTNSHGTPEFVALGYYVDKPFVCKACSTQEVWSATQQKWWYESAKGDVWTTAVLCKPCRRKEQERKRQARQVHLDGLARKNSAP
jgi:Probable zinc-ribbon domain